MNEHYCPYLSLKIYVLFVLSIFLLSGCYSIENVYDSKQTLVREEKANAISNKKIQKFISTIKMVDGELEAKYKLALYLQKTRKHKVAIEVLKEIIRQQPHYAKAFNAIGISYDKIGNYNQAIKAYKVAIRIDPNFDHAYNNLGYCYLLAGKPNLAIEAFQKAISMNETKKLYFNNLGMAYIENEQFDLALAQFTAADSEIAANLKLGKLLYRKGKFKLAKNYFSNAYQLQALAEKKVPVVKSPAEGSSNPLLRSEERAIKSNSMDFVSFNNQKSQKSEKVLVPKYKPLHRQLKEEVAIDATIDIKESSELSSKTEGVLIMSKSSEHILGIDQPYSENLKVADVKYLVSNGDNKDDKSTAQPGSNQILLHQNNAEIQIATDQDNISKENSINAVSIINYERSEKVNRVATEDKNKESLFLVDTEIEVANGNGAKDMAKRVGKHFGQMGLKVTRITNAKHFNFKKTKVYYIKPYLHDAYIVAKQIPGWQNMMEVDKFDRRNIKIKVVIGKDMIPYHSFSDNS